MLPCRRLPRRVHAAKVVREPPLSAVLLGDCKPPAPRTKDDNMPHAGPAEHALFPTLFQGLCQGRAFRCAYRPRFSPCLRATKGHDKLFSGGRHSLRATRARTLRLAMSAPHGTILRTCPAVRLRRGPRGPAVALVPYRNASAQISRTWPSVKFAPRRGHKGRSGPRHTGPASPAKPPRGGRQRRARPRLLRRPTRIHHTGFR